MACSVRDALLGSGKVKSPTHQYPVHLDSGINLLVLRRIGGRYPRGIAAAIC